MTTSIANSVQPSTNSSVTTARTSATADSPGASQNFSASLASALSAIKTSFNEVRNAVAANSSAPNTVTVDALQSVRTLLAQLTQSLAAQTPEKTNTITSPTAQANTAETSQQVTQSMAMAAAPQGTTGDSYSNSADYLARQTSYLTQAAANDFTALWINAGLNQAMASNVANGYAPESGDAVNTLRGYYSSDPQARGNAIRAVSGQLLATTGAYETNDYGMHRIVGAPPATLDTSTPNFSSKYDQDWNRPSLYDQINSSLGWNASNNNYADPTMRDATLNRKLTDAEVQAFQNNSLTPELQALVTKYRG